MDFIKNIIINLVNLIKEKLILAKIKYLLNVKIEFQLSNKTRKKSNT